MLGERSLLEEVLGSLLKKDLLVDFSLWSGGSLLGLIWSDTEALGESPLKRNSEFRFESLELEMDSIAADSTEVILKDGLLLHLR